MEPIRLARQIVPEHLPTAAPRHNLVDALTSFVGREREVAELAARLTSTRLLTLVGAGGVGKTRLAHHVGMATLQRYPAGVWLVELAPLTTPETIAQTVATVLGVREEPGRVLVETLVSAIRARWPLLLILDNCEHLVADVAEVAAQLLHDCPNLTILATSREALGIEGEVIRRVPSLALPSERQLGDSRADPAALLNRHAATRLFVERAQAVSDVSVVTEQHVDAIVQICRRLDGIPLAIELAAARSRMLTPRQIASRLDDRFTLLAGASRTALPRQRTLRAAIDWSYDLLTEPERTALHRLAVFVGGCTLEAAEVVVGAGSWEMGAGGDGASLSPSTSTDDAVPDLLEALTRLADKSLVVVDLSGSEARYGLLETIREYGLERLEASGEAGAIRRRHAAYFLDWAERAEPELHGPDQVAWLDRLAAEHEDFRTALAWTLAVGDDPVTALRLSAALGWFWFIRSQLGETRWLEAALAATASCGDVAVRRSRARALCHLAWIGRSWNDPPRTVALGEQSLALFRAVGDRAGAAHALANLGMLLRDLRDYPRAYAAAEEGLAIAREIGDAWLTAHTLSTMASVLYWDRFIHQDGAIQLAAPHRRSGDEQVSTPTAVEALASSYLQESLTICRRIGDAWGLAAVLSGGGTISHWAWQAGDFHGVTAALEEALVLYWHLRDYRRVSDNFGRFSELANTQDQVKRAVRLSEAGIHLSELAGTRPLPTNRGNELRVRPPARSRLSPHDAEVAAAEGRAMSLEQVIAYALRQYDPFQDDAVEPVSTVLSGRRSTSQGRSSLTAREGEIVELVAAGLSNREIAERLVISERTASSHVYRIMGKLGFASRTQLAVWALSARGDA